MQLDDGDVVDDVVTPTLWTRLTEALAPIGNVMRREEAADAVLRLLTEIADEWEDQSIDYYYTHRHRGPIDYATGFGDGWSHAADLLKGVDARPPDQDW